jgi:hypothetical protein
LPSGVSRIDLLSFVITRNRFAEIVFVRDILTENQKVLNGIKPEKSSVFITYTRAKIGEWDQYQSSGCLVLCSRSSLSLQNEQRALSKAQLPAKQLHSWKMEASEA